MKLKHEWLFVVALGACVGEADLGSGAPSDTDDAVFLEPKPLGSMVTPSGAAEPVADLGEGGAVQIVHLSPDAPAVDVVVNESRRPLRDLAYLDASRSIPVPAGTYTLDLPPAGGSEPAASGEVEVTAGLGYTALAYDELASLNVGVVPNDVSDLAPGLLRLQVVHTAVGVGPVDVWLLDSGVQILDDFPFGFYARLDVPPGPLNIGLDLDEDAVPDLSFAVPSLGSDTLVNAFVISDDTGVALYAVGLDGSTARVDADADAGDPPAGLPRDGLYRRTRVSIGVDNCRFFDTSAWGGFYTEDELYDAYLPDQARLVNRDGGFQWREAEDVLETQDPIGCDYAGASFSCDTQVARQRTTYSLYTTYAIDVAGEALSERSLVTDTDVRVLEMDTFSAAYIRAFTGIEGVDCEVSASMEWELID